MGTGAGILFAAFFALGSGNAHCAAIDAVSATTLEQFVAERCEGCHGPGGQGTQPMFPRLAGQRAHYLYREMSKFRDGKRKGTLMQVFLSGLQNSQIAALATYLSGLRRVPDTGADEPLEESGRLLYNAGNIIRNLPACATCHDGEGQRQSHSDGVPPIPVLKWQHAAYLEDQLNRFVKGTRLPGQAPRHPFASHLNAAEIHSVSVYLSRVGETE